VALLKIEIVFISNIDGKKCEITIVCNTKLNLEIEMKRNKMSFINGTL